MKAIADLVIRARAGDQNAMALIRATSDSAKQGSKRAQWAVRQIQSWIQMNPAHETTWGKETIDVYADELATCPPQLLKLDRNNLKILLKRLCQLSFFKEGSVAAAIILSNDSIPWSISNILQLLYSVQDVQAVRAFEYGFTCPGKEKRLATRFIPLAFAGSTMRRARGYQAVRNGYSFRHLDVVMAWELGE